MEKLVHTRSVPAITLATALGHGDEHDACCCSAEAVVAPGEAAGQQRRMLPWSQSLGPELGARQAERVLRKWQVSPLFKIASANLQRRPPCPKEASRLVQRSWQSLQCAPESSAKQIANSASHTFQSEPMSR